METEQDRTMSTEPSGMAVAKDDPTLREEAASSAGARRSSEVGKALDPAYEKASELRLEQEEKAMLAKPFPDDAIEIRPFDGLIYIPHIFISERLNAVLGQGEWSMVRRREFVENDTIYAEWVLKIRGCFVGESIGAQRYQASNPKSNYSDALEGTRGEAIRRIAGKDLSCGHDVWKPQYAKAWVKRYAIAVWAKDASSGKRKKMWRKKDDDPIDIWPWQETGLYASQRVQDDCAPPQPSPRPKAPERAAEEPVTVPMEEEPVQEELKPAEDEPWRAFPVPFGQFQGQPLGEVPKNKLFGFWANYTPKPYKGKISKSDFLFRQMLDAAGEHYEFTRPEDKVADTRRTSQYTPEPGEEDPFV